MANSLERVKREILTALRADPYRQFKINELSVRLRIKSGTEEHELMRRALAELEGSGEVRRMPRRRFAFGAIPAELTGTLRLMRNGSGMVEPDTGDVAPITVRRHDMHTALHGDRVRVRLLAQLPGGEPAGEVMEVLARNTPSLVGTVSRRGSFDVVIPDDKHFPRSIYVDRKSLGGARVGEKVVVTLLPWDDPTANPEGTVDEVLGTAGAPRVELRAMAKRHRLEESFPREVDLEAEEVAGTVSDEEIASRLDLRDTVCVTIDPEDARDFDDAVSITMLPDGNARIGVHIADVGHYVSEGTALDREAYKRGTSVYLVDRVIPMLPERLSNDLCSLRPDEDRLSYSIVMDVTPRGVVREYKIAKSIIRSRRRFTYDEALERIETGKGDHAELLRTMQKMADVLSKKRHREGGIDFDTPEVKFRLDEQGYPIEVLQRKRTLSTRLIEEFMLLANMTAAKHVQEMAKRERRTAVPPFLYRVHDTPDPAKIRDLAAFVKRFGYSLDATSIRPQAIQALLESVRGSAEEALINELTLRSMAKAVYAEHNIGHFGLSSPFYTHFTSPIRRYPDLVVHRLLFQYEHGMAHHRQAWYRDNLGEIADWCSSREQAAVQAERDSVKIAKAEYIARHVGDEFEGIVSGVQPYGIFVELKENYVEGLVRMRNIGGDFWMYDEKNFSLVGRATKRRLRLGDTVTVRVERVDRDKHEIDFGLVDTTEKKVKLGSVAVVKRGRRKK